MLSLISISKKGINNWDIQEVAWVLSKALSRHWDDVTMPLSPSFHLVTLLFHLLASVSSWSSLVGGKDGHRSSRDILSLQPVSQEKRRAASFSFSIPISPSVWIYINPDCVKCSPHPNLVSKEEEIFAIQDRVIIMWGKMAEEGL